MTNVLPQGALRTVQHRATSRILFAGSLMLSISAIVALIALSPALVSVWVPLMNTAQGSDIPKEQAELQEQLRSDASRARARIGVLAPYTEDRPSIQSVIQKLYTLRPAGVTLSNITYQSAEKGQGQIVITGTSKAREPVNDFRTILVKTGQFETVSVPVAALVGALEGNFTMTLTGTF